MGYTVKTEQAYAYAEMLEILDILGDEYVNRLPKKLIKIFNTFKDDNYQKHLNPEIPLDEQELSEKTKALVAVMLVNYWYESEEEKQELLAMYRENERKYQEELKRKYNPDNIFNNKQNESAAEVKTSSYIDNTTPEVKAPAREEVNTNVGVNNVINTTTVQEPTREVSVSSMAVEEISMENDVEPTVDDVVNEVPGIENTTSAQASDIPASALPMDMNTLPWYKKIFLNAKNFILSLFKKKDSSAS